MTTSLVRYGIRSQAPLKQSYVFRNPLDFDPFGALRTSSVDHNVTRTETGYDVEIPVPGYRPDQVDVTFKDGVLLISGKSERRTFSRSFIVPEDVDENGITGSVADGMLVLSLQRRPEPQPKRIALSGSDAQ